MKESDLIQIRNLKQEEQALQLRLETDTGLTDIQVRAMHDYLETINDRLVQLRAGDCRKRLICVNGGKS